MILCFAQRPAQTAEALEHIHLQKNRGPFRACLRLGILSAQQQDAVRA